jgi:hypothetical protein
VPVEMSRVTVRLPPIWAEQPAMWFNLAEAQFTLAGISSEQIKFCYVILQLDHWYATEVEDSHHLSARTITLYHAEG